MYQYKYVPRSTRKKNNPQGRRPQTGGWITGDDPIRRDKYYSWMKHRAQAKFRKEEHCMDFSDWEKVWTDEYWFNRGRTVDSFCLIRTDNNLPWCLDNAEIVTRKEALARTRKRRKK